MYVDTPSSKSLYNLNTSRMTETPGSLPHASLSTKWFLSRWLPLVPYYDGALEIPMTRLSMPSTLVPIGFIFEGRINFKTVSISSSIGF